MLTFCQYSSRLANSQCKCLKGANACGILPSFKGTFNLFENMVWDIQTVNGLYISNFLVPISTFMEKCIYPYSWWRYQLTKIVQNGSPQAISEILHIEYQIVCCIETYLIHIYDMSKCSKCNWNRYIEGFCMWNLHFHINGLSPNIVCYLNELTFNGNLFSFIELLTIFCAVFISYLMVMNDKKYKSKYQNTIWWILPCIMSELWTKQIAINP